MLRERDFRKIEGALLLLFLFSLWGLATTKVFSFDIFWQLASGRWMVEHLDVLRQDTFTLAASLPRIEHCWLHDVIFQSIFTLGGFEGISLLKGALLFATFLVLVATATRRGASPLAIVLLSVPALLKTRFAWHERPQLWSFLLFALFLLVLERGRRRPGFLLWLIPLTALWSNLHGGFPLAFLVVIAYGAGTFVDRWTHPGEKAVPVTRVGLFLFLIVAASFLNPYGADLHRFVLDLPGLGGSGQVLARNLDWRPSSWSQNSVFYALLVFGGGLLLCSARKIRGSDLFLLAGLGCMGLKAERHIPFFLFALVATAPVYLDAVLNCFRRKVSDSVFLIGRLGAIGLGVWGFCLLAAPAYQRSGFFEKGLDTLHYPVGAVRFMADSALPENIFNDYSWGGYVAWAQYPRYRAFYDGRHTSLALFEEGLQVQDGLAGWESVLERHHVNTALIRPLAEGTGGRFGIFDRLVQSPKWALVYADETATLFVRRSAVPGDWLARTEIPKEAAFDTLLSSAEYLLRKYPGAIKAYGEMANIYLVRRDYGRARISLGKYLARYPGRDAEAERLYASLPSTVEALP